MPSVSWVCYKCRSNMPNPGNCPECQQQLVRYPPADATSPPPSVPIKIPNPPAGAALLPGTEDEEDEILTTVKFRNVIPLPPMGNTSIPATGATLSRSQEILKATFDEIMGEKDDLGATMRFRGVIKVPLPTDAKTGQAPAPAVAAKKIIKKPVPRVEDEYEGQQESDEGLMGTLIIVAVVSLVVGISLTTAVLYFLQKS
jgi:hypothetical protein